MKSEKQVREMLKYAKKAWTREYKDRNICETEYWNGQIVALKLVLEAEAQK